MDSSTLRSRASIVCFNIECSHVLLVNSSARPDQWVFPGGGVESGESPSFTSIRELWEEAGASPISMALTDTNPFVASLSSEPLLNKKSTTLTFVTVADKLEEHYPEAGSRKRSWKRLSEVETCLEGSAVGLRLWSLVQEVFETGDLDSAAPGKIFRRLEHSRKSREPLFSSK